MLIKAGVDISRLKAPIRKKLNRIKQIVRDIENKELVITSTYEGTHSARSLHYANMAVDIRKHKHPEAVVTALKKALGIKYDILLESTHIHIEYDPL